MSTAAPATPTVGPLPLDADSRIGRFQSFLRIPTVANEGNRNGANERAIEFLRVIGENIGLQATVLEYAAHRPILLLTLPGQRPELQSILLNSHYDVVPVMREHWKVDPFAAEIDEKGDIYARGTQDMKSVCMQYLEAMHSLIRAHEANGGAAATGHQSPFLRTIHLSFQPDEETGGEFGMQRWTETAEFRALNVGFALDEGIANPADEFTVFFGERGVWWMMVKAVGPTGHGSRFIKDPATMKLMRSVQKFLEFRDAQEQKLLHGQASTHAECGHAVSKKLELGDVITINLTVLKAGVSVDGGVTYSMNVVPMEAEAGFDVRLPPHVDLEEFEARVKEWTAEDGMSYSIRKFSAEYVTRLDEERNPFWKIFKSTLETPRTRADGTQSSTRVAPQIFPAGTDSRFLRRVGIPVIGFSPLRLTPVLLHDHNERLNKAIYLDGIDVYTSLISQLANQPIEMTTNEDGVYRETKQPLDRVEQKDSAASAAPALP